MWRMRRHATRDCARIHRRIHWRNWRLRFWFWWFVYAGPGRARRRRRRRLDRRNDRRRRLVWNFCARNSGLDRRRFRRRLFRRQDCCAAAPWRFAAARSARRSRASRMRGHCRRGRNRRYRRCCAAAAWGYRCCAAAAAWGNVIRIVAEWVVDRWSQAVGEYVVGIRRKPGGQTNMPNDVPHDTVCCERTRRGRQWGTGATRLRGWDAGSAANECRACGRWRWYRKRSAAAASS